MSYEQPLNMIEEAPDNLRPIMGALCNTAVSLSQTIARGPLGGTMGQLLGEMGEMGEMGENADGDRQNALDVLADAAFAESLKNLSVRWYASKDQEQVVGLNSQGRYALAIDPLNGSSNIDVNASIGTIFSLYKAESDAEKSFLRPASEQSAAGYFIYGPQTGLIVTFGNGVFYYILDPTQKRFIRVEGEINIPETSHEFAINASNYRHWSKPVRNFINDCLDRMEGPHGKNSSMRWVASLVADTHRILTRGGIFLYPGDKRDGYENGRLRMLYECAPTAMIVEQAGGLATDGIEPLLKRSASSLHARTPFVFGSSDRVKQLSNYHEWPEPEISALFGKRSLFRPHH